MRVINASTRPLCTPAHEPLRTITASGKQSLLTWQRARLVPYYGSAETATTVHEPIGTLTTRDRYGLAVPADFPTDASGNRWYRRAGSLT